MLKQGESGMEMTQKLDQKAMFKETLRIAWPAVLESFFISLAGMIDTMMVSAMGTASVAAVGLTTQPKFITLAVFFSINMAVSALVARRRGQQNQDGANEVLLTALIVSVLLCVILSILSVVLADPVIRLCGSNEETHDQAVTYFRVIQGGMIFNVLCMVINAAQRGAGNTRIAMTTNVVSSLVNICFNYLLIGGNLGFPKLGIFGAAVATVLGTVVASVMSILSLFKKSSYVQFKYMAQHHIKATAASIKSIYKLGINMLIENFAMRIGFISTAVLAAKLGTDAFAAHQVGMNLLSLGFSFGDGMQVAAVALIGRSLGEERPDKAKKYGSLCQETGFIISLILAAIMFFFGKQIFGLFFTADDVIQMGVLISRFIMVIVLFQVSQIIFAGCLRGAGDVKYCLVVSLISVTVIRTLVTILLVSVFNLGLTGIWIGVFSDQFSRFILLSIRFRQGNWVNIKI